MSIAEIAVIVIAMLAAFGVGMWAGKCCTIWFIELALKNLDKESADLLIEAIRRTKR